MMHATRSTRQAVPALVLAAALLAAAGCSSAQEKSYGTEPAPSVPAVASVGSAYPYYLYVHCSIRFAYFDGQWWEADQPRPTPSQAQGEPQAYGTMTLVSQGHARFSGAGVPTVDFHLYHGTPPACS
jgi:hypothetical protein